MSTYKVKSGDTLSQIAVNHNTTVSVLLQLNPQITDKNKIEVGQVLYLSQQSQQEVDLQKLLNDCLADIEALPSYKKLTEYLK